VFRSFEVRSDRVFRFRSALGVGHLAGSLADKHSMKIKENPTAGSDEQEWQKSLASISLKEHSRVVAGAGKIASA
jgi:hypothetical protein